MTAPGLADCYVPVPIRWRHVIAGDLFLDRNGNPWHVTDANTRGRTGCRVVAVCRDLTLDRAVDPDAAVTVLMRADERDAANLLRTELGARLIERRSA